MSFLLRGLLIGLSIAAPVGPIGVLCIRRTLVHGRASGFISGLGAATADACYGSIAAFGMTFISSFLVGQQVWLRLIGGAFLFYLGIKIFLDKPIALGEREESTLANLNVDEEMAESNEAPALQVSRKISKASDKKGIRIEGLLLDYLTTFFLTLTNPMTILSFAAIFAGLGIASSDGSASTALTLVLGVFLGSALWWLVLSSVANVLRARFLQPVGLRWVNWISGAIITGFGVVALSSVLMKF